MSVSTAGGGATFKIDFYKAGTYTAAGTGTAVTLQNVVVNSYDIDSSGGADRQYQEFKGFARYELATGTTLATSTLADGSVRFQATTATNNSGATLAALQNDGYRVKVYYDSMSSFQLKSGAALGTGPAYFSLDFSVGPTWAGTTAVTGTPAPNITYSATTLAEAAANDGSITATSTLTLNNGTFAGTNGAALSGVSFGNVPAGLTAVLTRVDSTHATLSFTGNAAAHADANDVSNLTVTLGDAAFTSANASAVTGAVRSDLVLNFADVSTDTTQPTATIVVADNALAAGETSLVTITFSEAVTGFTNADLTVANGSLSAVSSADSGVTWTATFTPTANITDATNLITLDNTGVTDAAGNAGTGTTDSNNYAIDNVRPTLASSITVSDTALKIGDTATVTFTFTEAVTGFTTADVTVPNGTLSSLSSSDGGITWTATLTPNASTTAACQRASRWTTPVLTDLAGNTGTSTATSGQLRHRHRAAHAGLRPSPSATRRCKIGDTATVTFTFTEAVTGFTTCRPERAQRHAVSNLSSSDGGITWTATLTPNAGTTAACQRASRWTTTGIDRHWPATLARAAATSWQLRGGHRAPQSLAAQSITVSDTALQASVSTATVTFTFTEAVTGFTTADLTVPPRHALSNLTSGDGGITWTATLTPTAGATAASQRADAGQHRYCRPGRQCWHGHGDTQRQLRGGHGAAHRHRGAWPTPTCWRADETSLVTFTFSEAVTGFTTADDLTVANGVLSGRQQSSDGGVTWTATLTPTANINDATNLITLANTGVSDLAGNAGAGTTDSNNYAIVTLVDTAPPTANIVVADNALTADETSLVTITFSEASPASTTPI